MGSCFIIGDDPTGEWSGKANRLAAFTAAGWRFLEPKYGVTALVRSTGQTAVYRGGGWHFGVVQCSRVEVEGQQVLGSRGLAVADPSGGATVDAEGRAAIRAILSALRAHGLIEE